MDKAKKRKFSWINKKLKVKNTSKYGKGVFAIDEIEKDEILAIFGGYVMTAEEESKIKNNNDGGLQITENFVISSGKNKEDGDYFNHSCEPNAGFRGQIFLVAMRKIKKNEEVTFDYAMTLHRSKNYPLYKFKCFCGKKNCRKFICDDDWKRPDLRKKYKGFFQFYLEEKIKKLKR